MAENSKIEWTDHTVNLWWGCSKVHTGCKNCYAERLSNRYGDSVWGEKAPRKFIKSSFSDLSKYQKQADSDNKIVKVFIGSMMDIFEKAKPMVDSKRISMLNENTSHLRFHLFYRIHRGDYPNLIFLFLTKRPENINARIFADWKVTPPKNVWIGASISDENTANTMVEYLKNCQWTGNIFLSIEPQIEMINNIDLTGIDWVIQGGESGPQKRPFNIAWAERMKEICIEQKTPFFFKQIDKVQEIPNHLMIKQYPKFKSDGNI